MLSPVTEGSVTFGILGFFIPISGADPLWDSGQESYCNSEFLQSTLEKRGVFSTESTVIYSYLNSHGRMTLSNLSVASTVPDFMKYEFLISTMKALP